MSIKENTSLWKCLGKSVIGLSHEKRNIPCQDAHKWKIVDDKWLIIAVADGAGSAKHSDIGAKIAVSSAIYTLSRKLEEGIIPETKNEWRELLMKALDTTLGVVLCKSEELNKSKRDLASTLILVVLGQSISAAMQIGDGASVIQNKEGELLLFTRPDESLYINETTFLVSKQAIGTSQFAFMECPAESIAVFSDGIQMLSLKYPDWEPSTGFFNPIFKSVKNSLNLDQTGTSLESFLLSEKVRNKTDDDITLFLATREEKSNFK